MATVCGASVRDDATRCRNLHGAQSGTEGRIAVAAAQNAGLVKVPSIVTMASL